MSKFESFNRSQVARCAGLLIMMLLSVSAHAQTRGQFSSCQITPTGDNQTVLVNSRSLPMTARFIGGGKPASGLDVEVFVDSGGGLINGQSEAVLLTTDSNGVISFDYLAGGDPGPTRIGAFMSACFTGGGFDFNVNVIEPPPNVIMPVQGNNSTGTLSLPLPEDLIVEYLDAGGMPVVGRTLEWSLMGDSVLASSTTVTDSSGRSSNSLTLGQVPGVLLVSVADPLVGGDVFTFQINVAPPVVSFPNTGAPIQVSLGGLSDPFTASVVDNVGNPMNGVDILWTLAGSGSASSSLVSTMTTTGNSGMSSNQLMAQLDMTGDVQVTASVFDMAASDTLNILIDEPIIETFSGNGQSGRPGTQLDDLVVQLSLPSASTTLTSLQNVPISWSVISGDAQLGTTTSLSDASGQSRNPITLGSMPGDSVIQASAPGMDSTQFTVTALSGPVPGSQFSIVSGNAQMTLPGRPTDDLIVQLVDPDGMPIAGVTINWSAAPVGTSSVTSDTTVTDENGQSSNTAIIGLPGAAQVTANIANSMDIPALVFAINTGVANSGGLGRRQVQVAGAIDAACPALFNSSNLNGEASDLLARCSEIVGAIGNDPVAVANVLDNLATEETSTQGTVATETNVTQMRNVKSRMLALRNGQTGIDASGLVLQSGNESLPVSAFSSFMQADDDAGGSGASFGPWGFFINGRLTTGDKDDSDTEVGFDFNAYGLTAGVDYRVSNSFVLGAAIGYNDADNDINNNQGSLDITGYNLTGYATWYGENRYYLDTLLTVGDNELDSARRINYTIPTMGGSTTVNQTAFGSPDSETLGFAMSLGRDFSTANRIFSPYVRLDYTDIDIDGYSERLSNPNSAGAGLGLQVASQNIESLEAVLGARMSWSMSRSWGVFSPVINFEYAHEFDDDSRVIAASFLSDPTNTAFTVLTEDPDRDYFNLGVGASFVFSGGRSMFVNYDTIIGLTDITQHTLRIGGRFEF